MKFVIITPPNTLTIQSHICFEFITFFPFSSLNPLVVLLGTESVSFPIIISSTTLFVVRAAQWIDLIKYMIYIFYFEFVAGC